MSAALTALRLLLPLVAWTSEAPPASEPAAVVDLMTADGLAAVQGEWRYSDTELVPVDFRAPGADGQPTGPANRTWDFTPHAGAAGFDDGAWPVVAPETLGERRGRGRLSFNWYRLALTVPERIGGRATAGATLVLDASLDDYAEVWVDGELPRRAGQGGGSVVAGWNAGNRLVVARGVRPGQKIHVAIFGSNGPLSNPPTNYVFVRRARLELHEGGPSGPFAVEPHEVNVDVVRLDPALDAIVPPNPKVFKLAEGFRFTEGPVWSPAGYLLFSDPNANTIYKYAPDTGLSVFREHSGYEGADVGDYGQPGSNGLAFDPQGRLVANEHGRRRVSRTEGDGRVTTLAERFEGQRFNSPNDLVYRSDGALFFTDPPFGLPAFGDDPRRETPWSGVYALVDGRLRLLSKELSGPNGIAFSPDERFLYVGNWDEKRKVVMRYRVGKDGAVSEGSVFADLTAAPGEDAIDGIKVDERGDVYVSGPGGLWILSPEGRHLGTIVTSRHAHNFAWGDADRRSLYIAARGGLYRMRLLVAGAGASR
jgi:gluconolactonase